MLKSKSNTQTSLNIISTDTEIKGDINTNGDFRIDGTLIGSIISQGDIVIGNSGKIEGELKCQNATVSGTISAKITVTGLLTIRNTAIIIGDITTGKLIVEIGSTITGNIQYITETIN